MWHFEIGFFPLFPSAQCPWDLFKSLCVSIIHCFSLANSIQWYRCTVYLTIYLFLSLIMFFVLKYIFSDINLATPPSFWLALMWYIFISFYFPSFCMQVSLECGWIFKIWQYLLTTKFSPFSLIVITNTCELLCFLFVLFFWGSTFLISYLFWITFFASAFFPLLS